MNIFIIIIIICKIKHTKTTFFYCKIKSFIYLLEFYISY